MRTMPKAKRRQHKSTGIDVVASMDASFARIARGKLTIKQDGTTIAGIVPSAAAIAEIGGGVWLGDTIRRSGSIETAALCFRFSRKVQRKVKSAVENCGGNIVLSDNAIAGSDGLIVVPIKSGDCDKLETELRRSDYLQPTTGAPFRAWVVVGIIPRESTGSTGHETPVAQELDEYQTESDKSAYRGPDFYLAGSSVSPKRRDYTAGRNQPKASYNIDGRYTINELGHSDARNQPRDAKPSDEPTKVRTPRVPDLADTEH